jgi:hypothetical protein
MTQKKTKGVPDSTPAESADKERKSAQAKDGKLPEPKDDGDMPGADGRLSARADEDTYD